ncbi:MAG: hypothetical protein K6E84_03930 [Lachnospiraceae bacterium]|nr:hypothetical protein [Lachnospiraceae bacterium]
MKKTGAKYLTIKRVGIVFLTLFVFLICFPTGTWAKKKTVDIIVFTGQSNMMGHGNADEAPKLKKNAGYAYLPVTGKGRLSELWEPFGKDEHEGDFCNIYGDENLVTGSMVTAFVNAYYTQTGTPVVAVPAGLNGSGSLMWKTKHYKAVARRVNAAKKAAKKKFKIGHVYMVWLQGESDATAMQRNEDGTCESGMTEAKYISNVKGMFKKVKNKAKVSKCFVIRIPSYYGDNKDPYGTSWNTYFKKIQKAQTNLCKDKNFVMVYSKTPSLGKSYMQQDYLHINQQGLNKIGKGAGKAAGKFALKDK